MTSRSREGRRGRMPAIWKPDAIPSTDETGAPIPEVPHGTTNRVYVSWRIFSGIIVVCLSAVLFLFFGADAFYVTSVNVGGQRYISKEDIFALSGVANMHLFWIDPEQVRQNLQLSPTIADATVNVGWPPGMVQIIVQEREPALVWEQAGVATWIDLQGRVMRQWEDRDDLLRVHADNMFDEPLSPEDRIDREIVNGAVQLKVLMPNAEMMRYHPDKGLGFSDQRGWASWYGIGTNMAEKILIYNTIVADLQARGIQPSEVNVANPDAPFYCAAIEGCSGGA